MMAQPSFKNEQNNDIVNLMHKTGRTMALILQTREQQTKFFENIHHLLWSDAGLNPEKAMEHLMFFFAYRLIEPQIDRLELPRECRWSYIAQIQDENLLYEAIRNGINAFRQNRITRPFFFPKHDIDRVLTLERVVKEIN